MTDSAAASFSDASIAPTPRSFRVGTENHKRAFCSLLIDGFAATKPTALAWPTLSEDMLKRFVSLPFWDLALEGEGFATCRMQALADRQKDPLLRKALGISAFEAGRLKILLRNMLGFYGVTIPSEHTYGATSGMAEGLFLQSGYSKCFDSFLAFGLFKKAKDTGYLPSELLDLFEPLLQDQAHYSLFFINWLEHKAANSGFLSDIALRGQSFGAFLAALNARTPLLRLLGGELRGVLTAALQENERRLALYNPLFRRPAFMPFFAKLILKFLKV